MRTSLPPDCTPSGECRASRTSSRPEKRGCARHSRPMAWTFDAIQGVEVAAFSEGEEGEVWRWLAYAAGLFLLVELFFSWWFGRR